MWHTNTVLQLITHTYTLKAPMDKDTIRALKAPMEMAYMKNLALLVSTLIDFENQQNLCV